MPFIIFCDNKGCMKDQQPLLDPDSNEVLCSECGKAITNVTDFTKRQLKTIGQVKNKGKTKEPFSVKCAGCSREAQPALVNDSLHCRFCKKEFTHLSKPFELIVKNALKTGKVER